MEIKKYLDRAVKGLPERTDLTPSVSYSKEFELARKSESIAECEDKKISEVLKLCILLVGIRANNMPVALEFNVLKNFIRRHYYGNTVNEIQLAFEMAVAGQLSLGDDGAKAFENFSCEYVARILNAYRSWATMQYRIMEKTLPAEPLPVLTPAQLDDVSRGNAEQWFQWMLQGNLKHVPADLKAILVKDGYLKEEDDITDWIVKEIGNGRKHLYEEIKK